MELEDKVREVIKWYIDPMELLTVKLLEILNVLLNILKLIINV